MAYAKVSNVIRIIKSFENNQVFSEAEGWFLFSLAAILEAVGWSLLITGISLSDYVFNHNQIPILIAGQIHGLLFIIYLIASISLYPSLNWSRKKALVAVIASVIPFGSLLFELWVSLNRKKDSYNTIKSCLLLSKLNENYF